MRLPEAILVTNNQNRYCSRHEYLPAGPLSNFLSCFVCHQSCRKWPDLCVLVKKKAVRLPEVILEANSQYRYCSRD